MAWQWGWFHTGSSKTAAIPAGAREAGYSDGPKHSLVATQLLHNSGSYRGAQSASCRTPMLIDSHSYLHKVIRLLSGSSLLASVLAAQMVIPVSALDNTIAGYDNAVSSADGWSDTPTCDVPPNCWLPQRLVIHAGTPVPFVSVSGTHWVKPVGSWPGIGNCAPGVMPCRWTFSALGTYNFVCGVHGAAMVGQIQVEAVVSYPPYPSPSPTLSASPSPSPAPIPHAAPVSSGNGSDLGPVIALATLLLGGVGATYVIRRRRGPGQ